MNLKTSCRYASKASECLDYQRAGVLIDAYYPEDDNHTRAHSMIQSKIWIWQTLWSTSWKASVSQHKKDYRKSIETDESGDATKSVKAQLDGTLQQLQDLGPQANLQAMKTPTKI